MPLATLDGLPLPAQELEPSDTKAGASLTTLEAAPLLDPQQWSSTALGHSPVHNLDASDLWTDLTAQRRGETSPFPDF